MGQSPFARKDLFPEKKVNRRRSTRLDYVTPVILSGRDAAGQSFREETRTLIVNLHGAKLRTSHDVLVGMLVNVENPQNGLGGKAICVHVEDAPPGQAGRDIAVQLLKPGNIWGIETPPADWDFVAKELGGHHAVAEPSTRSLVTPSPVREPGPAARPAPPISVSRPAAEAQIAELEKRMAQLVEASVQSLRSQAEEVVHSTLWQFHQQLDAIVRDAEDQAGNRMRKAFGEMQSAVEALRANARTDIVRDALQESEKRLEGLAAAAEARVGKRTDQAAAELQSVLESFRSEGMGEIVREAFEEFQKHLEGVMAGADTRITQRTDRAFAEFESALETFRSDLGDELAAKREEIIASAEQALRAKVALLLSTILSPAPNAPGEVDVDQGAKK